MTFSALKKLTKPRSQINAGTDKTTKFHSGSRVVEILPCMPFCDPQIFDEVLFVHCSFAVEFVAIWPSNYALQNLKIRHNDIKIHKHYLN